MRNALGHVFLLCSLVCGCDGEPSAAWAPVSRCVPAAEDPVSDLVCKLIWENGEPTAYRCAVRYTGTIEPEAWCRSVAAETTSATGLEPSFAGLSRGDQAPLCSACLDPL